MHRGAVSALESVFLKSPGCESWANGELGFLSASEAGPALRQSEGHRAKYMETETRLQVGSTPQHAHSWSYLKHLIFRLFINVTPIRFRLKGVGDALSLTLQLRRRAPETTRISRGAPAQRPPDLGVQTGVSLSSPVHEDLLEHSLAAALHRWLSPGHGAKWTREEETQNMDSGSFQRRLLPTTQARGRFVCENNCTAGD